MTTMNKDQIRARARRAYELSRAGNALALGAIVAFPAMMISLGCCSTPSASVLCGLGLGSVVATARFLGMGSQRALLPGLAAGLFAFALPLACRFVLCPGGMLMHGGMCVHSGMGWIPYVAVGAALLGGMVLRLFFRDGSRLVAGSTALLLGSLGSLAAGLVGPILTAAGLAAGSLVPLKAMGGRGTS